MAPFRLYNDDIRYVFSRTCEHLLLLFIGSRLNLKSKRTIPLMMSLLLIYTLSRAFSTFLLDTIAVKIKNEEVPVSLILVAGSLSVLRIRSKATIPI